MSAAKKIEPLPKSVTHPATQAVEDIKEAAIELLFSMAYSDVYCNKEQHEDED